jgi:uncharacterized protein (TIGR00251 family)
MWYEIQDDFIIINVKAIPNSSKNVISEILNDQIKVKIKAPAVEGAANKELVKFFSKEFKVSKSDIEFIGGMTSKRKRIKLPFNEKVKQMLEDKQKNG